MPILFITSKETDYLADLSYAGLCELLGKEQILDFPTHWQYHRKKKFFWSKKNEYPKNLGGPPGSRPLSPLLRDSANIRNKNEERVGYTNYPNYEDLLKMLKKNFFELVILSSAKPDTLLFFQKILDWIQVPWIFIDGGDEEEVGGDFRRLGGEKMLQLFKNIVHQKSPALIFKRELPLGKNNHKVFPLPFSANCSMMTPLSPENPKKYQVLFWAVESSPVRSKVFELLKGKYDCEKNGSVAGRSFREFNRRGTSYFQSLNQTQIALSFRGAGFDTLRFWEIPACGSLLLSEMPTIQIPHLFENKKHALFCKNDLSDLCPIIDYHLAHPEEAKEIAREGQKHLLKFHTHRKRAEYLLEMIDSHLNLKWL